MRSQYTSICSQKKISGITQYSEYIWSEKKEVNKLKNVLNINIGNNLIFPIYLVLDERTQLNSIYSQLNIDNYATFPIKYNIWSQNKDVKYINIFSI